MLKISKKEFCSNIEAIEHELDFYETLEELGIFVEEDRSLRNIVIKMLEEKTNDEYRFIDWYLFEQPKDDGKIVDITSDSIEAHINVNSPRKLYELLLLLDENNIYIYDDVQIN